MFDQKKAAEFIRNTIVALDLIAEILFLDIDYDTFVKCLKMFKEFVQKQADVSGKT